MMPARLGHYLLLEQLHLGAFAEVYLGRTRSLPGMEQLVAIKRIHPLVSADEDFREAFLDEARIAAQLRHANIAQVLEVGEELGTYFIAMEYVSGRPLRALLDLSTRPGETLPSAQAAWLVSRICDGLEHAHGKSDVEGAPLGIVHRAISPENVLVSFDGEVKVIDFGLAKAANSTQHTSAGTLKGKLGYLSPEQVLGQPVDRRTDLLLGGRPALRDAHRAAPLRRRERSGNAADGGRRAGAAAPLAQSRDSRSPRAGGAQGPGPRTG